MEKQISFFLILLSFMLTRDHVMGKTTSNMLKVNGKNSNDVPGTPVILVPGDGGSQIMARLNKTTHVHYYCWMKEGWFDLWLSLPLMIPGILDCTVDNLRLEYDNKTHTTHNSQGVETMIPGFGDTSSVEYLSSSEHYDDTKYFFPIVNRLVSAGYKRGVSVRGAPYDFRKAPNEMSEYLKMLKKLVEDTYKLNNNTRVALVGHSMGNLYTLYFLNNLSQKWKDKYIQTFISLAGPWGGAAKTLRLMASGDNLGIFVVNPLTVRAEQRSMSSTAWMLPSDSFWDKDEVLVSSPKFNYTVNDYEQFLDDVNFRDGWLMRQDTVNLIKDLKHPGVDVHCLHGKLVDTPASFIYNERDWYDQQPEVVFGDGDGTVNMRSLHGCLRWNTSTTHSFSHQEFKGAEHMRILGTVEVIEYIAGVVSHR